MIRPWSLASLALVVSCLAPGPVERPRAQSRADWLVSVTAEPARVVRHDARHEIELTNGLIRRVWRVAPDAATIALDNLVTGQSLVRGVKPEAIVEIDGVRHPMGGLLGQPDYAYLRREWLETMTADPNAFHVTGIDTGKTRERLAWGRVRRSGRTEWPPAGASLTLRFESPEPARRGIVVLVHYELYDGIPLMSKWLEIRNESSRRIVVDSFVSEVLAVVEFDSQVENPGAGGNPHLQVESDYSFVATRMGSTVSTLAHWVPDPQYTTQVNYRLEAPVMLEVRPPLGPAAVVEPGARFETFRAFELVHDTTDRERRGLATRRMYRVLAPWATENPIFMHVRSAEPDAVRQAIDQCADVGFEMVILTFGSGFNIESEDPAYLARMKDLVDYGRRKGVELGGYSLLASRTISPEDDVINPKTGATGGAIFGNSPCLGSRWADAHFRKLRHFIEATGMRVLEHDGSYPGDVCASSSHPGHRGLADSQWAQWKIIADFYRWCRERGVYLNVPDWYFLEGANKSAMGYREVNWSLPRERQFVLGRQNIFDGTWEKTPSMGWMFVPLVEYHGGGAAATLEPLSEHLDAYEQHLSQNLLAGVQAAYRGPRLYDTPATRAMVKRWVDVYKAHRDILESDIVHVRRPDGRALDVIVHVNPTLREKALAVVHNPSDEAVMTSVRLPVYYAGLEKAAGAREKDGRVRRVSVDRDYVVSVPVNVPARGLTWLTLESWGRDK